MTDSVPQCCFDRPRIGVMAIRGDPLRNTPGDNSRRAKEGFCRCLIPLLTQQNINEISIPINRPVQVDRAPFYLNTTLLEATI
jgi:hypothetical protein